MTARFAVLAGLVAAAGIALIFLPEPEGEPGDAWRSLEVGGRKRSYLEHMPADSQSSRPLPVVLVLHGGGGHAESMVHITGFSEIADREGFLAVYPNGTGRLRDRLLTWNSSADCCGYARNHRVDDVAFLRALVGRLAADHTIDPRRVYATGLSNGAMMAYRLACEMSDILAAVGPVAGALDVAPCRPAQPVSVIAFNGTADEHVLYDGGQPRKQVDRHPRVDASVAEGISFWTTADGCGPRPAHSQNGSIVREVYEPCRQATSVELVTIQGGGHAWPGGEKWASWGPEPTREVSASETMWEFFARHPKLSARAVASRPAPREFNTRAMTR